ncbi:MAG: urate hydroxylase PuuD [Candidatus Omnitrophica bacterium]|nr:urate hydroxylase PuuD [Candidatus Omnitrophota bacterium]
MSEAVSVDGFTVFLFVLRWLHFIFGIVWIGLLYFFNFVNGPFAKTMDAATKKLVVPQLMPRALWWFRWGAMITFITGWLYITGKLHLNGAGLTGEGGLLTSVWGQWISLGALMGTLMWFNVWFIIWPAQKKLITWTKKGEAPPETAGLTRRAFLASRINTYLSVPLLFCMGAASHLPVFNGVTVLVMAVASGALVWHLVGKVAGKVGSNF